MLVTKQQIAPGKVKLKVTIAPMKYERYLQAKALELGQRIRVPGFRLGKAPYKILKTHIGKMRLLQEALNEIVRNTYIQAIEQEGLRPAMLPKIEVLKMTPQNPIEYRAEVVVLPNVVLPKLSTIKVKARPVKISKTQVDQTLDYLRRLRAQAKVPNGKISKNSKLSLPKLDDKFAQSVNPKFKSIEDLRKQLRDNIRLEQEIREAQRLEIEMMSQLIDKSRFDEIALELLDDVREKMIKEVKFSIEQSGGSWDDYLKRIKKTEKDLKDELKGEAEKRVKMDAVIAHIVDQHGLDVTTKQVEQEMNRFLRQFASVKQAQERVDLEQLAASVRGRLLNRKAIEFLKSQIEIKN